MVNEAAPENTSRDRKGTSNTQSKRFSLRFGISTLLMIMSLVATLVASETNRYRHRRILESSYDYRLSRRFEGLKQDGFFASGLTKLCGPRWNEVVTSILIYTPPGDPMSDSAFDSLTRLTHVRTLGFRKVDLNERQLGKLAKMKSLRWLYFLNTNVEQASIDSLRKSLPNTFVNGVEYYGP